MTTSADQIARELARRFPPPAHPCTPIVKWCGGKTRLLPELLTRMPVNFNRYYEPFAGGAALFFRLAPTQAVLADTSADLINLYRRVAVDVETVILMLEAHTDQHCETHYYRARTLWNDPGVTWELTQRAAAFVYLNKTCFNGLWRVNKSGEFNVPMGRYSNPRICDADGLRAAARVLARAELRELNYADTVEDAQPGDFVYFDPPYVPASATSDFTAYTADGFGLDEQRALADEARRLIWRGCKVMLSNSDTPLVRELYASPEFRIDTVKCARAINSNGAKRGAVDEVIITGGYVPGVPAALS